MCKCNHLSRFTAGESLYIIDTSVDDDVAAVITEEFDDKLPIMIIFLGVLLLMIIGTSLAEKVW